VTAMPTDGSTLLGHVLAGVARRSVPVSEGLPLGPWGARPDQRAVGVSGDITVTALALCDVDTAETVILVTADVTEWPRELAGRIRERITDATGVARAGILICATHTHSSLPLDDAYLLPWDPTGDGARCREQLVQSTIESAIASVESMESAEVKVIRRPCRVARSRRQIVEGRRVVGVAEVANEATVDVVALNRADGSVIASAVIYGCHPTTLGWQHMMFSPDWPGGVRDVLEEALSAPCLVFQGCGADRAPAFGFSGRQDDADLVGRAIGHVCLGAILEEAQADLVITTHGVVESGAPLAVTKAASAESPGPCSVSARTIHLTPPLRARDPDRAAVTVAAARQRFEAGELGAAAQIQQGSIELEICRRFPPSGDDSVEITLVSIGALTVLAWPGELSGGVQELFERQATASPFVVITNVNDFVGYMPTETQFAEGGYEADSSPFTSEAPGWVAQRIATEIWP